MNNAVTDEIYALFVFFNDTATTEIYTLSLHDALPIYQRSQQGAAQVAQQHRAPPVPAVGQGTGRQSEEDVRSEEHTSELQSRQYLVCRLLLDKKKSRQHLESRHLPENVKAQA